VGVSHHAVGFFMTELSIGMFIKKVVTAWKFKVAFPVHDCRAEILICFAYNQVRVGTK